MKRASVTQMDHEGSVWWVVHFEQAEYTITKRRPSGIEYYMGAIVRMNDGLHWVDGARRESPVVSQNSARSTRIHIEAGAERILCRIQPFSLR